MGFLVIFVNGYKNECPTAWHLNNPEMSWDGWAVGDHRYCSRHAFDKMRRFNDFEEAVKYVYERKKKHPKESYRLMYVFTLAGGGYELHPVSTLEEIEKLELSRSNLQELREKNIEAVFKDKYPFMKELSAVVSRTKAINLSLFIGQLKEDGHEAVKERIGSSFYKKIKELRALNIGPELDEILAGQKDGAGELANNAGV